MSRGPSKAAQMFPADHPLRIANFRAYWLSRSAGTIAGSAQGIIIGWQVYGLARGQFGYSLERSAALLGLIGLVQFVPLFLLTPLVGLTADTFDRRWIVRGTTALLALNAVMLGLLTWSGHLSMPFLFLAAGFVGVARAFSGPAYSALAPNLVPREVLPTAIAISTLAWQTGTIAGPSVGGVLYAIHPDIAYAVIATLFVVALALMFLIGPLPQPPAQRDRARAARRGHGDRRGAVVLVVLVPPDEEQCRGQDARRGDIVRRRDPDLRRVALVPVEPRGVDRRGRRRHGVGLCPFLADPAPHARCDARPGRRGVSAHHFGVERARRGGDRADGVVARSGRRGGIR